MSQKNGKMRRKQKMKGGNDTLHHFTKAVDTKFVKFLWSLDNQITRNLKEAKIETRPVKSNGLWCCGLLPTILVLTTFLHPVSSLYKLTACVSMGLLCYSLLFVIFISVSCLVLKETVYGGCLASGLVSTTLVYICMGEDLPFSLATSIPSVVLYSLLLRKSLTKCPKTFTIGEAMIVQQSVVLLAVMAVAKFWFKNDDDEEMHLINTTVFTVLSTVGLIVTALYNLRDEQRNMEVLGYIIVAAIIFTLVWFHILLGPTGILQIISYIFKDWLRIKILAFWLFLVVTSVVVVVARSRRAGKASSATRKPFHALAALVFLSGAVCDQHLMTLAAGLVFGLLILVEALRKSGIEPISSSLQIAFDVYSDEKDCGSFALTPLYLYAGLAGPLVLARGPAALGGALAVGVGDAAASWFGERYGNNRWPESNRTFEGSAFNVVSQVAVVYALQAFELLDARYVVTRTAVAATVSALVEARTDQVDNLILPLVTIIAFQLTHFLS